MQYYEKCSDNYPCFFRSFSMGLMLPTAGKGTRDVQILDVRPQHGLNIHMAEHYNTVSENKFILLE